MNIYDEPSDADTNILKYYHNAPSMTASTNFMQFQKNEDFMDISVINSKNLKAEYSSVENNNDNPLLFDERIVKKSDNMNSQLMKFNFDSQIKDNQYNVYNLKDLNSSMNASLNSE
jgi:hypothetical protein